MGAFIAEVCDNGPREVSHRRLRQFLKRAHTNLRRANDLSCDMISEMGVEHHLTDYSDGAVEHAEYLAEYIEKWLRRKS